MIALVTALVLAQAAASADVTSRAATGPRAGTFNPTYISTTGVRLNPLGLFTELRLGVTMPLSNSESPLFKGTAARVEGIFFVSPATVSPGVSAYIQPINLLKVGVSYTPTYYWGTFNSLQSYDSPLDDYAPSLQDDRDGYARWVHQTNLFGVLQFRVGDFALRNTFTASYVKANLRDDDRVYYDFTWDILAPRRGWVFQNDTDVVWYASQRLTVGARHTLVTLDYPDELGVDDTQDNVPISRAGPIALFRLSNETTGKIRLPTLFLVTQWWIRNRYRTGEDVTQLLPYVLAGVNFEGW
jgi:hypothetical protein